MEREKSTAEDEKSITEDETSTDDQGKSKKEKKRFEGGFPWQLFDTNQLSAILGISKKTIYNQTGKRSKKKFPIPFIRVGNLLRFDSRRVEEYLASAEKA